jgi:K+-transporting ATPase ATPase B chain
VRRATIDAFRKLDPRVVAKNPVMFVVEVGAAITTIVMLQQIATWHSPSSLFQALHRQMALLPIQR